MKKNMPLIIHLLRWNPKCSPFDNLKFKTSLVVASSHAPVKCQSLNHVNPHFFTLTLTTTFASKTPHIVPRVSQGLPIKIIQQSLRNQSNLDLPINNNCWRTTIPWFGEFRHNKPCLYDPQSWPYRCLMLESSQIHCLLDITWYNQTFNGMHPPSPPASAQAFSMAPSCSSLLSRLHSCSPSRHRLRRLKAVVATAIP